MSFTDAEYRSLKYESYSSLKFALETPRKYRKHLASDKYTSKNMDLGTALHHYIQGNDHLVMFEPDLSGIRTKSGVVAKEPKATDEGKKILAEFYANAPADVVIVPPSSEYALCALTENYQNNPYIQENIISFCKPEFTERVFLGDLFGLPVKCKIDGGCESMIVDYKTTAFCGVAEAFRDTVYKYKYHMQAGIYSHLVAQAFDVDPLSLKYYLVACETNDPYDIHPHILDAGIIKDGMELAKTAVERYKAYHAGTLSFHLPITRLTAA